MLRRRKTLVFVCRFQAFLRPIQITCLPAPPATQSRNSVKTQYLFCARQPRKMDIQGRELYSVLPSSKTPSYRASDAVLQGFIAKTSCSPSPSLSLRCSACGYCFLRYGWETPFAAHEKCFHALRSFTSPRSWLLLNSSFIAEQWELLSCVPDVTNSL